MLKRNYLITTILALMMISCTTPVAVKLPVPDLPVYPKLTPQELQTLQECTQCKSALDKLAIKDQMCRGSLKEHRAILK